MMQGDVFNLVCQLIKTARPDVAQVVNNLAVALYTDKASGGRVGSLFLYFYDQHARISGSVPANCCTLYYSQPDFLHQVAVIINRALPRPSPMQRETGASSNHVEPRGK